MEEEKSYLRGRIGLEFEDPDPVDTSYVPPSWVEGDAEEDGGEYSHKIRQLQTIECPWWKQDVDPATAKPLLRGDVPALTAGTSVEGTTPGGLQTLSNIKAGQGWSRLMYHAFEKADAGSPSWGTWLSEKLSWLQGTIKSQVREVKKIAKEERGLWMRLLVLRSRLMRYPDERAALGDKGGQHANTNSLEGHDPAEKERFEKDAAELWKVWNRILWEVRGLGAEQAPTWLSVSESLSKKRGMFSRDYAKDGDGPDALADKFFNVWDDQKSRHRDGDEDDVDDDDNVVRALDAGEAGDEEEEDDQDSADNAGGGGAGPMEDKASGDGANDDAGTPQESAARDREQAPGEADAQNDAGEKQRGTLERVGTALSKGASAVLSSAQTVVSARRAGGGAAPATTVQTPIAAGDTKPENSPPTGSTSGKIKRSVSGLGGVAARGRASTGRGFNWPLGRSSKTTAASLLELESNSTSLEETLPMVGQLLEEIDAIGGWENFRKMSEGRGYLHEADRLEDHHDMHREADAFLEEVADDNSIGNTTDEEGLYRSGASTSSKEQATSSLLEQSESRAGGLAAGGAMVLGHMVAGATTSASEVVTNKLLAERKRDRLRKGRKRADGEYRTNDGKFHDDPETLEYLIHLYGGEYRAIATDEEVSTDPYWEWKPKLIAFGKNYLLRRAAQRHMIKIRKLNMDAAHLNAQKNKLMKEAAWRKEVERPRIQRNGLQLENQMASATGEAADGLWYDTLLDIYTADAESSQVAAEWRKSLFEWEDAAFNVLAQQQSRFAHMKHVVSADEARNLLRPTAVRLTGMEQAKKGLDERGTADRTWDRLNLGSKDIVYDVSLPGKGVHHYYFTGMDQKHVDVVRSRLQYVATPAFLPWRHYYQPAQGDKPVGEKGGQKRGVATTGNELGTARTRIILDSVAFSSCSAPSFGHMWSETTPNTIIPSTGMRCETWDDVRQVLDISDTDETVTDSIRRNRIFTGYCLSSCQRDPTCQLALVHAPPGGGEEDGARDAEQDDPGRGGGGRGSTAPSTPYICRFGRYSPVSVTPGPFKLDDPETKKENTERIHVDHFISGRVAYGVPHGRVIEREEEEEGDINADRDANKEEQGANNEEKDEKAQKDADENLPRSLRFSLYTKTDPEQGSRALGARSRLARQLPWAKSISVDETLFEEDRRKLSQSYKKVMELWRLVLANEEYENYLLELEHLTRNAGDPQGGPSDEGSALLPIASIMDNTQKATELDRKADVETKVIRPHVLEGQQIISWLTEQSDNALESIQMRKLSREKRLWMRASQGAKESISQLSRKSRKNADFAFNYMQTARCNEAKQIEAVEKNRLDLGDKKDIWCKDRREGRPPDDVAHFQPADDSGVYKCYAKRHAYLTGAKKGVMAAAKFVKDKAKSFLGSLKNLGGGRKDDSVSENYEEEMKEEISRNGKRAEIIMDEKETDRVEMHPSASSAGNGIIDFDAVVVEDLENTT
ncbi:unnamed protein product [Amoebophrya sp. A25]|nr:unnamed protein product [Amoebophrya sp. A25]|eukprot:GSA25T00012924001.1